ncbi:hypothetical protein K504DRAFT_132750 [Pleomassaria siparia CBS 279.74]|uniref:Uncharacterized protein n=1 Tax=Pleomassaria siparia CBS 279.74 TaxID=1314801 RepID=A0A6G1KJU9_9PLEO|nr:hypothetical protein K504DRAFT_132750 [Pleomassaria siparia CBS 279.74]
MTSRSPSPAPVLDDASCTSSSNTKLAYNGDGLLRARQLKATLPSNLGGGFPPKNPKRRVEDDPENQLIKTLRQTHQMEWTAIANHLNEERLKRGEPPTMTQPSVYSRFVRNAPRIAAANGEVGFDPKDYMYLRHPHHYPNTALMGGGDSVSATSGAVGGPGGLNMGASRKRGRGDMEKELVGNIRKKSVLAEECAELEKADKTELLVQAVDTIDRNFWIFVADELERTTGKLYDTKVLCARYAAI